MLCRPGDEALSFCADRWCLTHHRRGGPMNRIIYLVGLVVIVLFILGFFGLR